MNKTFAATAAISLALIAGGCSNEPGTQSAASNETTATTTTAALSLREQYDTKMADAKIQKPSRAYDEDMAFCEALRNSADPAPLLAEAITRHPDLDITTAHRIARIKTMIPILCPDQKVLLDRVQKEFDIFPIATSGPSPTTAKPEPRTTFGNGKFLVHEDIAPGTYSITSRVSDCYWERSDAQGNIIDNNFISIAPSVTVTISDSDSGFTSTGCGKWTPAP
ncbi:hypothetical protein [Rhodococcus erythropolis]|uniref:hypothetical protein n=1 Tax=Rhodococcus erythropolis TaxID=1833 RepID=UPI00366AF369